MCRLSILASFLMCMLLASFIPVALAFAHPQSQAIGGPVFTLSGTTDLPKLPSGQVEVMVDDQVFSTIADNEGAYQVDVTCIDADDMVFIEIQGVGDLSHVKMSRVVTSCSELVAQAGGGGSFPVGRVSPLSTAVFVALRWYVERSHALSWPPSGPELEAHRHAIDLNSINRVLYALPSLIAEHHPLPTGKADTLEVILDREALLGYITDLQAAVDPQIIDNARKLTLWNSGLNARTSVFSDLDAYLSYCPRIAQTCTSGFWREDSQLYFGWTTVGGEAELTFRELQDPIFGDNYVIPDDNLRAVRLTRPGGEPLSYAVSFPFDPEHGQIELRTYTDFNDVRFVDASESIALSSRVEQRRDHYPGGQYPDEISLPVVPAFYGTMRSDMALPDWTGPSAGESWYAPLHLGVAFGSGSTSPFRWDRLTFNGDGSGQSEMTELTFNWSMVDGSLVLTGQEIGEHRYTLLGGDLDRHPLFEVVYLPGSDDIRADAKSLVRDNGPPAFTPASVPGRYSGGFDHDEFNLLPNEWPRSYLTFELHAGGTGWRGYLSDPMAPNPPADAEDVTWEVDEHGRLVIERESFGSLFGRAWIPIALDSGMMDLYVVEYGPYVESDLGFEPPLEPGRLNFYRKTDLDDL